MTPEYQLASNKEPFFEWRDDVGETMLAPFCPREKVGSRRYTTGWFARLSMSGFLDCTEWAGPFDSLEGAQAYIERTFEVHPITGELLE